MAGAKVNGKEGEADREGPGIWTLPVQAGWQKCSISAFPPWRPKTLNQGWSVCACTACQEQGCSGPRKRGCSLGGPGTLVCFLTKLGNWSPGWQEGTGEDFLEAVWMLGAGVTADVTSELTFYTSSVLDEAPCCALTQGAPNTLQFLDSPARCFPHSSHTHGVLTSLLLLTPGDAIAFLQLVPCTPRSSFWGPPLGLATSCHDKRTKPSFAQSAQVG